MEAAAWSSDGKRIVIFSDGDSWIFDTTTGEQLVELSSGFTGTVWSVSWSPGGERIFAIGGDGTYRVFEAETGRELLVYELGGWPDGGLSPDGTQMLLATNDGKTSLYPTWHSTQELIDYAYDCCVFRNRRRKSASCSACRSDEETRTGNPPHNNKPNGIRTLP